MFIQCLGSVRPVKLTSKPFQIFLPANNQTVTQSALKEADAYNGEGSSGNSKGGPAFDMGAGDGFQQAMNSRVIENI